MSAAIDSHPGKILPKPISRKFGPAIPEVKCVNLALQGGSAHGAFTWGVLDQLLEEPRIERDKRWRNERGGNGPWADHRRAQGCTRGPRRILARRRAGQCPVWRVTVARGYVAVPVALSA